MKSRIPLAPEAAARDLYAYCRANNWAGHDPYDGLNSRLLPLFNWKVPRLLVTQALKRSPIDLRGPLMVPKTQNPKGLALALMALLRHPQLTTDDTASGDRDELLHLLTELRSPGSPYWCWGYSFPWQTRTVLVPRHAPSLVCTTFVANALLDAYECGGDRGYLTMAASAADYLLKELYWTGSDQTAGFAYPLPSTRDQIHNANLLGAALLARVARATGNDAQEQAALRVARYSAGKQRSDGSWLYGETRTDHWIDNFHTGYNLCAIKSIADSLNSAEFASRLSRGFEFYRTHFIDRDGIARYFHDSTYPIDVHCIAQTIITLVELQHLDAGNIELASRVLTWALEEMRDRQGFFYYRRLRWCTIRIPYMRWSQAWMLLAMATFLASPTSAEKHAT